MDIHLRNRNTNAIAFKGRLGLHVQFNLFASRRLFRCVQRVQPDLMILMIPTVASTNLINLFAPLHRIPNPIAMSTSSPSQTRKHASEPN